MLKVITEAFLRNELRREQPELYYVPEGSILSPAAREYLQQRKIKIAVGEPSSSDFSNKKEETAASANQSEAAEGREDSVYKYTDFETGAFYLTKPEHMTQLYGNVLVAKNHPRISFRGKLDSLQALIVLDQVILAETSGNEKLITDFSELLNIVRELMRCDVLNEMFQNETILGLTHDELRAMSHNPMKHFKIKQMVLPDYKMGKVYAILNQLRTAIRETEISAIEAFREGTKYIREDMIEELNRLSSAVHIMMCMYLAGQYKE